MAEPLKKLIVSFIIIGFNEESKIVECIKSVKDSIHLNGIQNSEIIYVDSQSTDNSVKVVSEIEDVKIYAITGRFNAAVARNIGAIESNGTWLVFIDGDMEINPGFFEGFLENTEQYYQYISGQLENCYLDRDGDVRKKTLAFKNLKSERVEVTTGGVFAIKREAWENVGGMDTRLKRTQDIDLGFRLHAEGISLLRRPEIIASHYSMPYENQKDFFSPFKRNIYMGVLWRKHFFGIQFYNRFYRIYITTFLFCLLLLSILAMLGRYNIVFPIFGYLLFLILYSGLKAIRRKSGFIRLMTYYFQQDLGVICGFLFRYPDEIILEYIKIK
jgi:glycosyltransferase involved in cell wall biosynthesis